MLPKRELCEDGALSFIHPPILGQLAARLPGTYARRQAGGQTSCSFSRQCVSGAVLNFYFIGCLFSNRKMETIGRTDGPDRTGLPQKIAPPMGGDKGIPCKFRFFAFLKRYWSTLDVDVDVESPPSLGLWALAMRAHRRTV